jgi:hypothetical protein
MAGRVADVTTRKGKEVHRLCSGSNLPAAKQRRLEPALRGISRLAPPLPEKIQVAVNVKAWAIAGEVYELSKEHLARRIVEWLGRVTRPQPSKNRA